MQTLAGKNNDKISLLFFWLLAFSPFISSFPTAVVDQSIKAKCPDQNEIDPCICRQTKVVEFTCNNINAKRLLDVLDVLRKDRFLISSITISDSNLENIPSNAFAALQIEKLLISESNVISIDETAFAGLGNVLKELVLAKNRIVEIPSDSFRQLKSLKVLDLNRNKIEHLQDGAFSGLENMEELYLQNNDIAVVDQHSFKECCGDLLVLNMASNMLSTIPTEAITPLTNMSYLKLHDNNINTINKRAFNGLTALNKLDLSNNYISVLEDYAFSSSAIHSLILENNSIQKLPDFAFAGLENSTEWLDLSYNGFSSVPSAALSTLRALRHLDIANNKITQITQGTFINFGSHLRYLELNSNNLQSISPMAFQDLPTVEFVMLNNNNLRNLSKDTVESILDTIFILDISENPLECRCDLKWLKDWYGSINPMERLVTEPTCFTSEDGQMLYIGQLTCSDEDGSTSASYDQECTDLDCIKALYTFFSKRTWWY